MSVNKSCKCSHCQLVAAIEVVGDDHAIKREFYRIEQAAKRKANAQRKTPSVRADGV